MYFGHVNSCPNASKKRILSPACFTRYYNLKNPAIWLAKSILTLTQELEFPQIWGLHRNINSNIIFHFIIFPERFNSIFQNIRKIPFLPFLALSVPKIEPIGSRNF